MPWGDDVAGLVLSAVVVVLLINFIAAILAFARRGFSENWLLVVLLTGTTGAALVALLVVLGGDTDVGSPGDLPPARLLDIGVILTGTAALTAAVRAVAGRRPARQGGDEP